MVMVIAWHKKGGQTPGHLSAESVSLLSAGGGVKFI